MVVLDLDSIINKLAFQKLEVVKGGVNAFLKSVNGNSRLRKPAT